MFLTWADLQRADLRGADLRGTILNSASLHLAILDGADLGPASLHGADLRGARLSRTNLAGAMLEGADLRGAIGLTAEQLSPALIDASTQLSPDLANDPWVVARLRDCEKYLASPARKPWGCPTATQRPTS
ncbi:pentapeptide repeat-containing protein [Hamadaea tsunoensis]|uniref:pentapeptide repeat-containing protein n=1 Tax=Hamadaea tsunoensis TaxID=53368 RepID=UPI00389920A4